MYLFSLATFSLELFWTLYLDGKLVLILKKNIPGIAGGLQVYKMQIRMLSRWSLQADLPSAFQRLNIWLRMQFWTLNSVFIAILQVFFSFILEVLQFSGYGGLFGLYLMVQIFFWSLQAAEIETTISERSCCEPAAFIRAEFNSGRK